MALILLKQEIRMLSGLWMLLPGLAMEGKPCLTHGVASETRYQQSPAGFLALVL